MTSDVARVLHRKLIGHELAHAVVGLLAGRRLVQVSAPPPPPDLEERARRDPDEVAGYASFIRGDDPHARALSLLGDLLYDDWQPHWPLGNKPHDERQLRELLGETDELTLLEHVTDTRRIMESAEYEQITSVAAPLLEHLYSLTGEQVQHIGEALKPPPPDTDCPRDELGVVLDDGGPRRKAIDPDSPIAVREAAIIGAAFERASAAPQRKTVAPLRIVSFEC
jgi:hypothetical protein